MAFARSVYMSAGRAIRAVAGTAPALVDFFAVGGAIWPASLAAGTFDYRGKPVPRR